MHSFFANDKMLLKGLERVWNMKKVTFIHAADLHLDSPMTGLKHIPEKIAKRLRESTFRSLNKIVNAAIQYDVDFLILAGDLYDGEDRSLRAQSIFRKEMKRLADKGIPVYAIHGNHDHLNGTWVQIDMPNDFHTFSTEVEVKQIQVKSGATVNIYGFSYPVRHVTEKKIDDYKREDNADFHIGILHGHDGGSSEHGKYAPFLLTDLISKNFDYWALGHIHKRSILNQEPPIIYSGNIQGRNRKETGEKGCYLVSLGDTGSTYEFMNMADIIWDSVIIDGSEANTIEEILSLCHTEIEKHRVDGRGSIISLRLENIQLKEIDVVNHNLYSEILDLLQEGEEEEESFVWITNIVIDDQIQTSRDELQKKAGFYGDLFQTIDQYDEIHHTLSPLYEHNQARKFLEGLSKLEEEELLQKAETTLLRLLSSL